MNQRIRDDIKFGIIVGIIGFIVIMIPLIRLMNWSAENKSEVITIRVVE